MFIGVLVLISTFLYSYFLHEHIFNVVVTGCQKMHLKQKNTCNDVDKVLSNSDYALIHWIVRRGLTINAKEFLVVVLIFRELGWQYTVVL